MHRVKQVRRETIKCHKDVEKGTNSSPEGGLKYDKDLCRGMEMH
jgi:hypothetical protein